MVKKNNTWVITNCGILRKDNNNYVFKKHFHYYRDYSHIVNNIEIIYAGYVLPRDFNTETNNTCDLVYTLYKKYGKEFVHKIKGNFIIIIIDGDNFYIFSDRFGIKKYFYWFNGSEFIISNDLKLITKNINAKPSTDNMAIYALTYHFVGGKTIFENVNYNKPAEIISFINGKLSFSKFWDAGELLNYEIQDVSIEEISEMLTKSVEQSLDLAKASIVSHSLTAGVDSRILFAILKKTNKNLHLYTYGNKNSIDCVIAKNISEMYKVPHSIYDIKFNNNSFNEYAKESISLGQSLSSLHRAHRLKSIEEESQFSDNMFIGTMGGEFIKGANREDYIITNFIYEFSEKRSSHIINKYLRAKFFDTTKIDIEYLFEFFSEQSYVRFPDYVDYYGLVKIAAHLHHAQNDLLYSHYLENVFTPYLDIDYLELLFRSKYNFIFKNKTNSSFYRRLLNHQFGSELLLNLDSQLTKIPFNSGFVPDEYLNNRYFALLTSRLRKRKWNYVANFPLTGWIEGFVKDNLKIITESDSVVNSVFNLAAISKSFQLDNFQNSESFWLKYTLPIQMEITLKEFS